MKLPEARIEYAAGNGDVRYYLNGIYLDSEAKQMVATNGHILACVPYEPENGDASEIVPVELVKAARVGGAKASDAISQRQGENNVTQFSTIKWDTKSKQYLELSMPAIDGKFPDYKRVTPDKPSGDPTITLNADLLADLQAALCAGKTASVSLWVTDDKSSVYVEGTGSETGAYGVIMPKRP